MFQAFAEILALLGSTFITSVAFKPINITASALFIPYLLWVSFAAALNFKLWRLNPDAAIEDKEKSN